MNPIRILLADDHELVRAGFRRILQDLPGIEVAGEADNGYEVLELAKVLQPDLVLMDIAMPKLSGLEATRRLRQEAPHVRVIILSMHANEEYVRVALHAGAVGYLLKDSDLKELEIAIRAVARGESYLSPPVSQQPIADYMTKTTDTMNPLQRLTSRQREVLQLIAEGHTTKEIAYLLKVSVKTIETHRKELMERLNIRDLPGLVRFAIRSGLVSPDQ